MKSLISGINGFVGQYLKEYLIKKGHEVIGFDRKGNGAIECDLLDAKRVDQILKDFKPDYVFHLAAQSSVSVSWKDPDNTKLVNVTGTKNLLDAVKNNCPEAKILIVGSSDIYGSPEDKLLTENSKLSPKNPYGVSRKEQEKLIKEYNLDYVIVRSFSHTGPGQNPMFVCSDFAKQIAEIEKGNDPVIKTGDLSGRRDFTDVRDIVKAYVLALEKCQVREIYNVCSGNIYSLHDVLNILIGMTKENIEVITDETKLRKNDTLLMAGDNSKFVSMTGWNPKISMEQTLKDLLDFWRKKIGNE